MRKSIYVLALVCLAATLMWAAAGDVNQSGDNGSVAWGNWVAVTANSSTAALNTGRTIPRNHTVLIVVTGGPAGCTANLDGTLDGTNWASLSGNQTCTSTVMFHVDARPVTAVRVTFTNISGGTSPTATAYYAGVR